MEILTLCLLIWSVASSLLHGIHFYRTPGGGVTVSIVEPLPQIVAVSLPESVISDSVPPVLSGNDHGESALPAPPSAISESKSSSGFLSSLTHLFDKEKKQEKPPHS